MRGIIRISSARTGAGHPAILKACQTWCYHLTHTFLVGCAPCTHLCAGDGTTATATHLTNTSVLAVTPTWGPCQLTWQMRCPASHVVVHKAALSHTIVSLTGSSSSIARHLRVQPPEARQQHLSRCNGALDGAWPQHAAERALRATHYQGTHLLHTAASVHHLSR